MKKILVLVTALLCTSLGHLYAQGILFTAKPFQELQKQAKAENKLIFIDFHTEWCVPCKAMQKNVFPDSAVGAFFNKEFISIELDAEKEGKEMAKKYNVNAYPTLIFINADGELISKKVGALQVTGLIEAGKKAVETAFSPESYSQLKKIYPIKKNDEQFLITYIKKMIEFKESPVEAIEHYLSVQKSMKENQSEMMEFFLNHYSSRMILGGKAEEILNNNYKEFIAIATNLEAKSLTKIKLQMLKTTRRYAYYRKDVSLYAVFLDRYLKFPEAIKKSDFSLRRENYNDYLLEYLRIKEDKEQYKMVANTYLDSLVRAKTIDQIRKDDKMMYEQYNASLRGAVSEITDAVKESMKVYEAKIQNDAIINVGEYYLQIISNKTDYEKLINWVEYGKKLLPDSYLMPNFNAKVLLAQGKIEDAIQQQKYAISKLPVSDIKVLPDLKKELTAMQKKENKSNN